MCCFSVQKEIQRGVLTPPPRCADCFTCSWFPCRNNHFHAHFFFLEEEKSASVKGETEMLVLAVRDHIDLYQSGSQTCSYNEVGILWRISVLPMAAYVKQNPKPEKHN